MDSAAAALRRIAALQRIRRLARLLDTRWAIPGTSWRFGLDPLIGLLPAVGGIVTVAAGIYLLIESRRVGAPWTIIAQMAGNLVIDAIVGEAPLVGDIFDFAFKAHVRNLRLLERWLERAVDASGE